MLFVSYLLFGILILILSNAQMEHCSERTTKKTEKGATNGFISLIALRSFNFATSNESNLHIYNTISYPMEIGV